MNYCAVCPRNYEPVPGDGPQPASVMLIGERPGRNENYRRRNFIGESGKELTENYLRLAGLERDQCRVINTVRCFAQNNKTPTDAEVEGCSQHFIPDEIEQTQPEVVMLLGATACKLIGGIDLDSEHGIPRRGELFGHECWLVPHWHPAAALHDTSLMSDLLEDWELLKPWLRSGKWMWAIDRIANRQYSLAETTEEVRNYFAKTRP